MADLKYKLLGFVYLFGLSGTVFSQCTFDPPFVSSSWHDNTKGTLTFTETIMSGWGFSQTSGAGTTLINTWDCLNSTLSNDTTIDSYLVFRSRTRFLYPGTTSFVYSYLCMKLTKITDVSYYYYQAYVQDLSVASERLRFSTSNSLTSSIVCDPSPSTPVAEYHVLVKTGSESAAAITCPNSLLFSADYTYYDSEDTVYCDTSSDTWDGCSNTTEMVYNYTTCTQQIAYSDGGIVSCIATIESGGYDYTVVYNQDSAITGTAERFSCISSDGYQASVAPNNCSVTQVPSAIPKQADDKTVYDNAHRVVFGQKYKSCGAWSSSISGGVIAAISIGVILFVWFWSVLWVVLIGLTVYFIVLMLIMLREALDDENDFVISKSTIGNGDIIRTPTDVNLDNKLLKQTGSKLDFFRTHVVPIDESFSTDKNKLLEHTEPLSSLQATFTLSANEKNIKDSSNVLGPIRGTPKVHSPKAKKTTKTSPKLKEKTTKAPSSKESKENMSSPKQDKKRNISPRRDGSSSKMSPKLSPKGTKDPPPRRGSGSKISPTVSPKQSPKLSPKRVVNKPLPRESSQAKLSPKVSQRDHVKENVSNKQNDKTGAGPSPKQPSKASIIGTDTTLAMETPSAKPPPKLSQSPSPKLSQKLSPKRILTNKSLAVEDSDGETSPKKLESKEKSPKLSQSPSPKHSPKPSPKRSSTKKSLIVGDSDAEQSPGNLEIKHKSSSSFTEIASPKVSPQLSKKGVINSTRAKSANLASHATVTGEPTSSGQPPKSPPRGLRSRRTSPAPCVRRGSTSSYKEDKTGKRTPSASKSPYGTLPRKLSPKRSPTLIHSKERSHVILTRENTTDITSFEENIETQVSKKYNVEILQAPPTSTIKKIESDTLTTNINDSVHNGTDTQLKDEISTEMQPQLNEKEDVTKQTKDIPHIDDKTDREKLQQSEQTTDITPLTRTDNTRLLIGRHKSKQEKQDILQSKQTPTGKSDYATDIQLKDQTSTEMQPLLNKIEDVTNQSNVIPQRNDQTGDERFQQSKHTTNSTHKRTDSARLPIGRQKSKHVKEEIIQSKQTPTVKKDVRAARKNKPDILHLEDKIPVASGRSDHHIMSTLTTSTDSSHGHETGEMQVKTSKSGEKVHQKGKTEIKPSFKQKLSFYQSPAGKVEIKLSTKDTTSKVKPEENKPPDTEQPSTQAVHSRTTPALESVGIIVPTAKSDINISTDVARNIRSFNDESDTKLSHKFKSEAKHIHKGESNPTLTATAGLYANLKMVGESVTNDTIADERAVKSEGTETVSSYTLPITQVDVNAETSIKQNAKVYLETQHVAMEGETTHFTHNNDGRKTPNEENIERDITPIVQLDTGISDKEEKDHVSFSEDDKDNKSNTNEEEGSTNFPPTDYKRSPKEDKHEDGTIQEKSETIGKHHKTLLRRSSLREKADEIFQAQKLAGNTDTKNGTPHTVEQDDMDTSDREK